MPGRFAAKSLNRLARVPAYLAKYGRQVEHKLLHGTEVMLGEADRFDENMVRIINFWRFRIDRMFTPNFVNHIHSMCALVLNVLQVLIIFEMIHSSHGHLGNVANIHVVLLPTYVHVVLRLVIQLTVLVFVIHRAFHMEQGHPMLVHFQELGRFKPVVEQLIPVVTYTMMLCTALAVGFCHINVAEGSGNGLCSSFTLSTVKGIVGTYAFIQVAHHLIAIYHVHRHAEIPRRKSTGIPMGNGRSLTLENRTAGRQPDKGDALDLVESLDHFDEGMTEAWKWWEYRMNRILGASVSHHLCKLVDVILESVTVVLLVSAAHNSHGNLQNLQSIGSIFIPVYLKLFAKAFIQLISFAYYCHRSCNVKSERDFAEFLHEPSMWVKPIEHAIPFVSYVIMGVTALAVGFCHLDITDKSLGLCKVFPYGVVKGVVVVVALCQLLHHFVAIYHHHAYASKPKRKRVCGQEIPMSDTTSHYGQLQ